jgi:hypothetical protein
MPTWYYTKDRKNRIGPLSDAQLQQLIAARQVVAADMVWWDGLPSWLPVGQVPELAAALAGAPQPTAAPVPVQTVTPAPAQPASIPVQTVPKPAPTPQPTPAPQPAAPVVPVAVQPVPVQPVPVQAAPAKPIPVQPVPVQALPAATAPVQPAGAPPAAAGQPPADPAKGGLSAIGGFFKKGAAAVVPPRAAPAAVPVAAVPAGTAVAIVRPAPVLPAGDGLAAADTGDYEPEQFARCREYLREAGFKPEEIVFFCSTRNRKQPAAATGLLSMMSKQTQTPAVIHFVLTQREVALVHEGEERKIVVQRAAHETVSWKFADPEEANQPTGMAAAARFFKRDQPPPERIELLRLGLGEEEHELRFTPGAGLQTLRKRAAEVFQARARAFVGEGKYYHADLVLRQVETGLVAAPELEALQKQIGTVAEADAHYQGGHPELLDCLRGVLRLDALGLEFVAPGVEKGHLRISYDRVLDILEPQRGDFPEEMVKGAQVKKSAGRAVGMLSGLAGAAMSATDTPGGKLVSGVGKTVASDLKEGSQLGAPPRNRLCVVVLLDGVKHRL